MGGGDHLRVGPNQVGRGGAYHRTAHGCRPCIVTSVRCETPTGVFRCLPTRLPFQRNGEASQRVRYTARRSNHEKPARPVLIERPLRIKRPYLTVLPALLQPPTDDRLGHLRPSRQVADPWYREAPADIRMRGMLEREIPDREHRQQLKAWVCILAGTASVEYYILRVW
jgi:hypothetical protein